MIRRRSSKAMVLIIVLWAVALLAVVCIVFASSVYLAQSRLKYVKGSIGLAQAQRSALAAVEVVLLNDDPSVDMIDDSWCKTANDEFEFSINGYDVSIISTDGDIWRNGLSDETARMNANVATAEMLAKLPEMDEALAGEFIRLRDMLNKDAGLTGPIEDSYQLERLLRQAFDAFGGEMDELKSGKPAGSGESADPKISAIMENLTVYTRTVNVDSAGKTRLNINTASKNDIELRLGSILSPKQVEAIISERQEKRFENIAQLLTRDLRAGLLPVTISNQQFQQMADMITVTDAKIINGLININTAGENVLRALPGLTDEAILELMSFREFRMASHSDIGGKGIGWLLEVLSPQMLEKICSLITTRSYQFRCYVAADDKSGRRLRLFVIERYNGKTAKLFTQAWRKGMDNN